ncbi:FTR1 family protein, partial [Kitasatospora sp. NPDC093679]|uniref:FTR1 family protein n=1 Tax=Kitasatospora sp. NPDC093679 TaxID=3154983 RepID=UPI00342EF284
LVVVAAGVLAYGVHDLQEAGWIPGLTSQAFDVSSTVPKDSWYGTLLKGVFNFQPDPTTFQVIVWAAYLVPVLALFLRKPAAPAPKPAAAAAEKPAV